MYPRAEDGKLSFQDVLDYRDKLREEFEAKAKEDLEALGVDTDLISPSATTPTPTRSLWIRATRRKRSSTNTSKTMRHARLFAKIVTLSKLTQAAETKLFSDRL